MYTQTKEFSSMEKGKTSVTISETEDGLRIEISGKKLKDLACCGKVAAGCCADSEAADCCRQEEGEQK